MHKSKPNFMDLEENKSSLESSKVVILPVPFEKTVSFGKGTAKGPGAIIYASSSLEEYDDELDLEPSKAGIHTFDEISTDIESEEMIEKVADVCSSLENKFVITIGGEHSITVGAVKGHKKSYEDFSVLSIDAHCDLRNIYEESKLSHACVMRRVIEMDIPVVEVGIRSYSLEEAEFIKNSDKVKIFHARDIIGNSNRSWINEVVSELKHKVYISFDVDGLDPSLMPSTGTPEPGGLTWYDATSLLKEVFTKKKT